MIPLSAVRGYDLTLKALSTAAMAELRALLKLIQGLSPKQSQRILFESFPEVFSPYVAASSEVSASFYEEVRAMAGVGGVFAADTAPEVELPRWDSLVGAGTRPRFLEQGASNLMFQFLSGGLTSILSAAAADTMYLNAQQDPLLPRFQRVPQPGCCGFCGMLASRGAAYVSEASATRVVGRGVPVERTRGKSGGQGKGVRSRGARAIGEQFHDFCRCRAVQVYEGNAVELEKTADKYLDAYSEARDKVDEGLTLVAETSKAEDGSLKNTYKWVDSDGKQVTAEDKTKMIATSMRHALDVK